MTLLTASGVSRSFARRRVLRDVSFDACGGEVIALLGPNGAGKSTLLRVLAGQIAPTSGRVTYAGGVAPAEARGYLGVLGHEPQLYGELTARENLVFFARLAGMPSPDDAAVRGLTSARLADRSDELVERFSRGMRQRLAFERSVLHAPSVVLLDEPFTGLDAESVTQLVARLRELREAGCLVVMATHDLELVDGLADRAWLLRGGRLVDVDMTRPLIDAYRLALEGAQPADRGSVPPDAATVTFDDRDDRWTRDATVATAANAARATEASVADILRTAATIAGKDLRVEWRRREAVLTTLLFATACVLVFSFGLVEDGRPMGPVGPAVLWVAITFAGTLAMARTFERERAAGTLTAMLQTPAPASGVFLGKWTALVILLLAVDVVLLPLIGFLFQMPLIARGAGVVTLVVAGTAAYAVIGTLFAAMLARTQTRDVLLPLLVYPMTVPVMIGGVRGTAAAVAEPYLPDVVTMWLALLLCFGAVFLTLALWTFGALMTDTAPRNARGH